MASAEQHINAKAHDSILQSWGEISNGTPADYSATAPQRGSLWGRYPRSKHGPEESQQNLEQLQRRNLEVFAAPAVAALAVPAEIVELPILPIVSPATHNLAA
jgi:hypothetical protein